MAKSSFFGTSSLLYSLYKTFFPFQFFGSCSSPALFSLSLLYKNFFVEKENLASPPADPVAVPWLVLTNRGKEGQFFYNLCERPHHTTRKRNIPEMNRARFTYFQSPSHQGWLIVRCRLPDDKYPQSSGLKYGDCFLWDPVSLKKIWLPSLCTWITNPKRGVVSAVLSAPPTINSTVDGDSVVFFLLCRPSEDAIEYTIVFCRPGDNQWRSQTLPEIVFALSMTCFKGKLHVICNHDKNNHLVIEKQLGPDDNEMSLSIATYAVSQDTLAFGINREKILLESRGELFVVVVDYHLPGKRSYENITSFQVFRMNFSLMVWEKVTNLGDHVLFVGGTTKASCYAADLGLTRGYVYFTLPKKKTLYVFDIEEGTISFENISFSDSTKRCFKQAEWLAMPTSYIKRNCRVSIKTSVEGNSDKAELCNKKKKNQGTKMVKLGTRWGNLNMDIIELIASYLHTVDYERTKMVKSGTSWGNLDMDILELIASYLHTVDYLHFRSVCKANRSVASIVRKKTTREISHTISLSPWIILLPNDEDCVYKFINPMHNNETYLVNLSEFLSDATIHCSKGGWLLMSQSCRRNLLFFFNPFTRVMIRLPELLERDFYFEGISFSSSPTSSDCVVFAIQGNGSEFLDIYSISRGDEFWGFTQREYTKASTGKHLRFKLCRTNPVFLARQFFCLGTCGNLGVFYLSKDEDDEDGWNHSWKVLDDPVPACTCYSQSFLVECKGQLLSVFVTPLNKTRPVQIFQLRALKNKRLAWAEVTNLGNYMLFVSHTCCIAAVAPVSRMKNKIYFPRLHKNRILFFSLDTCRYQTLFLAGSDQYSSSSSSSSSFYSTKKHLYSTWIEPNWSDNTTAATELVW